jgi:hypothetical protein
VTHTSTEYHSPLTQEEKLREVKQDQKAGEQQQAPATFKDFASAFANENRGGRFGKSGTDQTIKPLPPNSPWASNPVPDEPPLGFDINQVPDLGFPLNKSVAEAPSASPSDVETATMSGAELVLTPDSAPTSSEEK